MMPVLLHHIPKNEPFVIAGSSFVQAECLFSRPTNSIKAITVTPIKQYNNVIIQKKRTVKTRLLDPFYGDNLNSLDVFLQQSYQQIAWVR